MTDPQTTKRSSATAAIEATFSTLTLSMGTQAIIAMGLMENPATGQKDVDMDVARFNIDLLRMLREKTKGNLSEPETKLINDMVADLQMKYVHANK